MFGKKEEGEKIVIVGCWYLGCIIFNLKLMVLFSPHPTSNEKQIFLSVFLTVLFFLQCS